MGETAELVDSVNELLEESFGTRVQGNYRSVEDGYLLIPALDIIVKNGILIQDPIGRFTNGDGTLIRILPKYEDEAREYARLYEKTFSSNVRVTVAKYLFGPTHTTEYKI